MSKKTPTSSWAGHAPLRPAFYARVLLHSSVLFIVALFPCPAPSLGLLNVTESEAPVDQDEPSEEEAVSVQARSRVDRDQTGPTLLVPAGSDLSLASTSTRVPHSGHRLPNNLLAPLRC